MNKKKVLCIIVAIFIVFSLLLLFKPRKKKFFYFDYSDEKLEKLRSSVYNDLQNKNFDDSSEVFIVDKLCGLKNDLGICYFNTAIQFLFADRRFLCYIILQKFNLKQKMSLIMQRIAFKMLTNSLTDIKEELVMIREFYEIQRFFGINTGGDPVCVFDIILKILDAENMSVCMNGSASNFFIIKNLSFTCLCGMRNIKNKKKTSINIGFGNRVGQVLEKHLNKYKKDPYKNIECKACKRCDWQKINQSYILPKNLFLEINRNKSLIINKIRNFEEIEISEKFTINDRIYKLYAVICIYVKNEDGHANVFIKKGKSWYLVNDSNLIRTSCNNVILRKHSWVFAYREIADIKEKIIG
ncbi:hypothetical protein GVAV_002124 [Gurleya vavrai]